MNNIKCHICGEPIQYIKGNIVFKPRSIGITEKPPVCEKCLTTPYKDLKYVN